MSFILSSQISNLDGMVELSGNLPADVRISAQESISLPDIDSSSETWSSAFTPAVRLADTFWSSCFDRYVLIIPKFCSYMQDLGYWTTILVNTSCQVNRLFGEEVTFILTTHVQKQTIHPSQPNLQLPRAIRLSNFLLFAASWM